MDADIGCPRNECPGDRLVIKENACAISSAAAVKRRMTSETPADLWTVHMLKALVSSSFTTMWSGAQMCVSVYSRTMWTAASQPIRTLEPS